MNWDLNKILNSERPMNEESLPEDLLILQPDGSRACVNWELRGNGFALTDLSPIEQLSDSELLKSAYFELDNYSGYGFKS